MPSRPRLDAYRVALGLGLAAVTLSACSGIAPSTVAVGRPEVPLAPLTAPTDPPAASTAPSVAASPALSPANSPRPVRPAFTYDVAAAQRVLTAEGYYVGAIDGRPGPALRSAVMAFQKVNGLGADGVVGPATIKGLAAPKKPVLKGNSPADRVEVDLSRQVLYVVKGNRLVRIMPVSSGNGASYAQKDGGKARALTPVGYYTIQRRIVGERKADLGSLYDPQYFYRGWAIHGSNSVPAGPASHGCVRVTRTDAKYLLDALRNGMAVYLYGGAHTFPAGSSAPGTSNPTGDTTTDSTPAPVAQQPTAAPAASSQPTRAPQPSPTASSQPSGSPSPAEPTASPTQTALAR